MASTTQEPSDLPVIIGCSVAGGVALIAIIVLVVFCVLKVKKKRAYEGKYSPSGNELKGGLNDQHLSTVMQPPLPERLI